MRRIRRDVSVVLDYVLARFRVIRHVRPKTACPSCGRIVQVDAPSRPLERGFAGAGLLAYILTATYADYLPLYRQASISAREGVALERSMLAECTGGRTQRIEPLTEALERYVFAAATLHADDRLVPLLDPGHRKTKTGSFWTGVRDEHPVGSPNAPAVLFRHSPDWRRERPRVRLRRFSGIL